ncbi:metallophosphoesterase family protein [Trinickia mobilis]|uniref:metallophosphoesterase family protein n=1 Tax=Trinickia mobilis TaxID=2816356 RepID=UPI001A8D181B|nr:metallophosphoesterase [Trinickia mobilis]
MRIQIASDLHHEFARPGTPGAKPLSPAWNVDVLVLAGDVHWDADALGTYDAYPVPVVYVYGNHELYGGHLGAIEQMLRIASPAAEVHFLERDELLIGDVRFLGTCLWTDYCIRPELKSDAMLKAIVSLNDHRMIKRGGPVDFFFPHHAEAEHKKSRTWLEQKLSEPFSGKTVVVTHHAPHPLSIPAAYREHVLAASFASDLSDLVSMADLWIHGHVHESRDYTVGKCRVICNPRGYPLHRLTGSLDHNAYENPLFNPALVVEL